jgi:hypothetical protein
MAIGTLSICSAAWVFGLIPPFSSINGGVVVGVMLIVVVLLFITGGKSAEDIIRGLAAKQPINSDSTFWFSVVAGFLGGSVVFVLMWIFSEWWKGL